VSKSIKVTPFLHTLATILQAQQPGTSNYNSLYSNVRIAEWHGLTRRLTPSDTPLDEDSQYRGCVMDGRSTSILTMATSDFDNAALVCGKF